MADYGEEQPQKLLISRHLFWASDLRDTNAFLTALVQPEKWEPSPSNRGGKEVETKLSLSWIICDLFCDLVKSLSTQINSEHHLIHQFKNFTLVFVYKEGFSNS